jgi:hypothetical protein
MPRLDRLLLSGALKPTRTILRREGLLISAFAVAGALAAGFLIAQGLFAAFEAIVAWAT